jgi:hypothetical protein
MRSVEEHACGPVPEGLARVPPGEQTVIGPRPGSIVLFGSGEIAPSAQPTYDYVFRQQGSPVRFSILETPAGFEPNSDRVAGRIAEFVTQHLRNHAPQVSVVPARRRGTPFSPDDPEVVAPLLRSDVIFLGPGSPTYAIRQLRASLAWEALLARHQLGGALILASAATIAVGAYALPVYEIYKAGHELHWHDGLNLLGAYGLRLVFVPHWNNREGGADLDTSHCFMGKARFRRLAKKLPAGPTLVGIDEHTSLIIDWESKKCLVMGVGSVTIVPGSDEGSFRAGEVFSLSELGAYWPPRPGEGISPIVWQSAMASAREIQESPRPSPEVLALVRERENARAHRDWVRADALRARVVALGWQINDTPGGSELHPATPTP